MGAAMLSRMPAEAAPDRFAISRQMRLPVFRSARLNTGNHLLYLRHKNFTIYAYAACRISFFSELIVCFLRAAKKQSVGAHCINRIKTSGGRGISYPVSCINFSLNSGFDRQLKE